jgi:ketosteroid isomerase-like protein
MYLHSFVRATATRHEESPMDGDIRIVERMYERFNARDIDGVLAELAEDVAWANGMEGGHVHGLDAVRAYWTRQWAVVSPRVVPVGFSRKADGAVVAEVLQTIRDLDGNPLVGQDHGLKDKTVGHVFHFRDGKVARFDIEDVG